MHYLDYHEQIQHRTGDFPLAYYPVDEDYRPWTSVRKGNLVGMIDSTGRVRVPVKFSFANRAQIIFRETEKGELAPARDAATGLWGVINRKGEWKQKPVYKDEEEIKL